MIISDGGPAHPVPDLHMPDGQIQFGSYGMSIRDHFAGLAMAAIIPDTRLGVDAICTEAYQYADAMIRAREASQ